MKKAMLGDSESSCELKLLYRQQWAGVGIYDLRIGGKMGFLPGGMISIKVSNLTKRFGDTVALDRVNVIVEQGEIFFLLGPSGCGKTTLLRTIAGFYTPDEGRILFGDEDVTHVPPHRRNTGMM